MLEARHQQKPVLCCNSLAKMQSTNESLKLYFL